MYQVSTCFNMFQHVSTCFNIHACRNFWLGKRSWIFNGKTQKVNVLGQFGTFRDFPLCHLMLVFFDAETHLSAGPKQNFARRILKVFENLSEKLRRSATCRAFFWGTHKKNGWIEPGFMADGLLLQWKDIFKAPLNCDYLWIDMSCIVSLYLYLLFLMFVGSEPYSYHRCL
jgi:hypothetical protein